MFIKILANRIARDAHALEVHINRLINNQFDENLTNWIINRYADELEQSFYGMIYCLKCPKFRECHSTCFEFNDDAWIDEMNERAIKYLDDPRKMRV